MDIEFICVNSGGHKSIKDALQHSLGDMVTCEHIGCDDVQKEVDALMEDGLEDGEHHGVSLGLFGEGNGQFVGDLEEKSPGVYGYKSLLTDAELSRDVYQEGEEDIFGNVRVPANGGAYNLTTGIVLSNGRINNHSVEYFRPPASNS